MAYSKSDKKRLAKNTILLYGRTIVVMLISLYVSRLVLNILGVTDYGVYNAVGGMVGMFSIISGSLVAATQRYLSFELGKNDGNPSYIFSLAMGLHLLIAIVILALAEIIGIWFLNSQMNLPVGRLHAANWVFQFSILTFLLQIMTIPYNAIIVAQEEMGIYALVSIVEALLKLGFAIVLLVLVADKLIYYSVSVALVSSIVFAFNKMYCRRKYRECCSFKLETKPNSYKQLGSFIGWNFIGSTATVLSKQGVNVLLNIFCGVVVNAGRGVAAQVDNAVNQFINSFTTALRPQITKTYAAREFSECFGLVNQGTKIIMGLTLLFVIPLTLRTEYVLTLWLRCVPDYAVIFTRLSFLVITMDALSTPLYYLMLATGKIRTYQIVVGTLSFLTFPLTWIALELGLSPEITYYVLIIIDVIRWVFQLLFLRMLAQFNVKLYMKNVILPFFVVAFLSIVTGILIDRLMTCNFVGFVVMSLGTTIVLMLSIFSLGLTPNERIAVRNVILTKFVMEKN